jgi:hypothetical protein
MLRADNYFVLTFGKEEVIIEFHSRYFGVKLPSEIFAQNVLKKKVIISGLRCCVHQ